MQADLEMASVAEDTEGAKARKRRAKTPVSGSERIAAALYVFGQFLRRCYRAASKTMLGPSRQSWGTRFNLVHLHRHDSLGPEGGAKEVIGDERIIDPPVQYDRCPVSASVSLFYLLDLSPLLWVRGTPNSCSYFRQHPTQVPTLSPLQ